MADQNSWEPLVQISERLFPNIAPQIVSGVHRTKKVRKDKSKVHVWSCALIQSVISGRPWKALLSLIFALLVVAFEGSSSCSVYSEE